MHRTTLLFIALGLLVSSAPACVAARIENSSPFRASNQHAAQLTALHAAARPPRVPDAGRVVADTRIDWTSHWMRPGYGSDEIVWDGETFRTEIDVRVGLGSDLDFEVGLPFMHSGGGTLDGFIENFHDIFGFPQNDRDIYPRDEYEMAARRRQPDSSLKDAYLLEKGFDIGDVPLFLTWIPYHEDGLSLGLRGGVELPTGSESKGYGNGGVDANIGFLGGADMTGWSLFFWGGHTFVAQADRMKAAGVDNADVTAVGVGTQVALTETLFALVQVEFETSVLRNLDETRADRNQLLIWFGGRWRVMENLDIELAGAEELILNVSPDWTFHLGLTYRF